MERLNDKIIQWYVWMTKSSNGMDKMLETMNQDKGYLFLPAILHFIKFEPSY